MQAGLGSGQSRDVAVGPSRVVAARVFGAFFDDVHVTSYEDLGTEIDLGAVRSLGLVGGAHVSGVLAGLVAGARPGRVLIGLPEDLTGRDEVLEALASNPALRPSELVRSGSNVVVVLGSATEVAEVDAEQLLATLRRADPTAGAAPAHSPGRLSRLISRLKS